MKRHKPHRRRWPVPKPQPKQAAKVQAQVNYQKAKGLN